MINHFHSIKRVGYYLVFRRISNGISDLWSCNRRVRNLPRLRDVLVSVPIVYCSGLRWSCKALVTVDLGLFIS